jgi:hypothetical protein
VLALASRDRTVLLPVGNVDASARGKMRMLIVAYVRLSNYWMNCCKMKTAA